MGSFDVMSGPLVAFFNPGLQLWEAHFAWNGPSIQPLTAEARVTERILRLNEDDRVAERQALIEAGVYLVAD